MSLYDPTEEPLSFDIGRQPDSVSCGPTCLHAVYAYFGLTVPLAQVTEEVPKLELGGTLGVMLATHALGLGFSATIITWNLQVFDPTWFNPSGPPLRERLLQRSEAVRSRRSRVAALAYAEFLERGGRIEFRDLDSNLLRRFLRRRLPILTGLSATFLYRESRERPTDDESDDVAGEPVGHFVVLTGYDAATRCVLVSDPLHPNRLSEIHTYPVKIERVIGAIYLGVLTHDANLVVIEPRRPVRAK